MSPVLHINEMPDLPYRFILPAKRDEAFHADKFDRGTVDAEQYGKYIDKMRRAGLNVSSERLDFCNCPLPTDIRLAAADALCEMISGGQK